MKEILVVLLLFAAAACGGAEGLTKADFDQLTAEERAWLGVSEDDVIDDAAIETQSSALKGHVDNPAQSAM